MATTTQEATALIGVFPNRREAEQFVHELKQAGLTDDQIGVASPHEDTEAPAVQEGALAGAIAGGSAGVLAGLAVAAGLVPGIGPVLAGGVLAGILASAATGVAAGGILGALIALGIPEEQAREYETALKAGRTLVVVRGERLPEALAILRRHQHTA